MFLRKSPFCPLFGSFYPHFAIQSALRAAGASRYPAPKEREWPHPRIAVRRGRHAGLLLITVLPKTLGTFPTYIVYDNVTQCFGHAPLAGTMRFSQELKNWLRSLHCRLRATAPRT